METDLIGQAYHEGRGSITVRGKARIEGDQAASPAASSSSNGSRPKAKATRKTGTGKPQIIITELPYQSNKVQCACAGVDGGVCYGGGVIAGQKGGLLLRTA
jgi:DNA gyrase/topoisomerase IV subunit A